MHSFDIFLTSQIVINGVLLSAYRWVDPYIYRYYFCFGCSTLFLNHRTIKYLTEPFFTLKKYYIHCNVQKTIYCLQLYLWQSLYIESIESAAVSLNRSAKVRLWFIWSFCIALLCVSWDLKLSWWIYCPKNSKSWSVFSSFYTMV